MLRSVHRTALVVGVALLGAACSDAVHTDVLGPIPAARSESGSGLTLVTYRSHPTDAQVEQITALGGTIAFRYQNFPIVAASLPTGAATMLLADPTVASVEPDIALVPYGSRQVMDWGVAHIDAPGAWALGYRGNGVKVGIFDSGIDVDHPDLHVAGGVDLVGDGNGLDDCQGHGTHVAGIVAAAGNAKYTVGVAPRAQLYSMRLADCNWGGGTIAKMIAGLDWAINNNMDVINMSFGFVLGTEETGGIVADPLPPSDSFPPNNAAEVAFQRTNDAGIVLIAASGNSSTPYVGYPAAYSSVVAVGATDDTDLIASFSQTGTDQEVTAPGVANLSSMIMGRGVNTAVYVPSDNNRELDAIAMEFAGMTDSRGITAAAVYAGFGTAADYAAANCPGKIAVVSRGGPTFAQKATFAMDAGCAALIIHNVLPGQHIGGTLGTETASGGRPWIPVLDVVLEDGLYLRDKIQAGPTTLTVVNATGDLATFSGTSMASPHAAGVAALILNKNRNLTPRQVRDILAASSDDLGTPGWDPVFGYGRVNARKAVQRTP